MLLLNEALHPMFVLYCVMQKDLLLRYNIYTFVFVVFIYLWSIISYPNQMGIIAMLPYFLEWAAYMQDIHLNFELYSGEGGVHFYEGDTH